MDFTRACSNLMGIYLSHSRIKFHVPTEVVLEFYKWILNSMSKKENCSQEGRKQRFRWVLFRQTFDVSLNISKCSSSRDTKHLNFKNENNVYILHSIVPALSYCKYIEHANTVKPRVESYFSLQKSDTVNNKMLKYNWRYHSSFCLSITCVQRKMCFKLYVLFWLNL